MADNRIDPQLRKIYGMLAAYNRQHGTDLKIISEAQDNFDKSVWTAKVVATSEQYSADICTLAVREVFNFGGVRLKRICDKYIELYDQFNTLMNEDDEDLVYTESVMERMLQQACGKNYVPRDERYNCKIMYGNSCVAETDGTEGKR